MYETSWRTSCVPIPRVTSLTSRASIAERSARTSSFVYDEEALKERLHEAFEPIFAPLVGQIRPLREVIDSLLHILSESSIPQLDEVDGLTKTALGNLYCNEALEAMDRRTYLNSLLTKYETFLKKLYYLIHSEDVPRNPKTPTKSAGLAECIFAFDSLRGLRYRTDEVGQAFSERLDRVRAWRNEESHLAPEASESEVQVAVGMLVALYLYFVAYSITDLESTGRL